jgi:hypothetical protein
VRFQSAQFNRKLGEARNYRRTAKPLPEGGFQLFLTKIGMGSRWSQAGAVILLLAILYLVYVPNFLSVNKIEIHGLGESDRVVAEGTVREAISTAPFYNPQRNLLFLSKERITKALVEQGSVFGINKIEKEFFSRTLIVDVQPKVEAFTLLNGTKLYSVYNDGAIKDELAIDYQSWLEKSPSNTIKIKNSALLSLKRTDHFLSLDFAQRLLTMRDDFQKLLGRVPTYIELQLPTPTQVVNPENGEISYQPLDLPLPISPIEVRAYLTINEGKPQTYYMLFDMGQDVTQAVERLQLLLSQTAPERYQQLAYIDMRLPNKSFICLIGAPCVGSPVPGPEPDPLVPPTE